MASITATQESWNQAYGRLVEYLESFALGDRAQVSRLAVALIDEARTQQQAQPESDPTLVTMRLAQNRLAGWLTENLAGTAVPAALVSGPGSIALLLSGATRRAPEAFLRGPLPEELRQALRETLLTTGPDLHVSSMTPRHLDYGPMLDLARQTWHRWDLKSILAAVAFWAGVYAVLYWGIIELL